MTYFDTTFLILYACDKCTVIISKVLYAQQHNFLGFVIGLKNDYCVFFAYVYN
jgi:hypothetical protein